jgi:hypothetical protein
MERCRAIGHAWYETEATVSPLFGVYFWLRCESCGMIRKDILDRFGGLLSRSYDAPDGYRATGDELDLTRADYRLRLVVARVGPDVIKRALDPPPKEDETEGKAKLRRLVGNG